MTVKISDMTSATTPLTGTEEMELVQGGNTLKATVSDLNLAADAIATSGDDVAIGTTPPTTGQVLTATGATTTTWQTPASASGVTALSVANIDDPSTELNAIDGSAKGDTRLCYQTAAGTDEWTLYAYDDADSGAEDVPYLVDGTTGVWAAIAGKYNAGTSNFAGVAAIDARTAAVAHFSHDLMTSTTEYAVKQTATGVTTVNSAVTEIDLRIGGTLKVKVEADQVRLHNISGTAALPAVAIGATDRGFYVPGANQIGVSTAGVLAAYWDSAQHMWCENGISANQGSDETSVLGRCQFDSRVTTHAFFSNYGHTGNTEYALKQELNGDTVLNALTGQEIDFDINGVKIASLSVTTLTLEAGKLLSLGGNGVDDILVAADSVSTGDDELPTCGYLNARYAQLGATQTFTGAQQTGVTTLTSASPILIDAAANNSFVVTLDADRQLDNPTNLAAGMSWTVRVIQDGTGTWALTFDTYYDFGDDNTATDTSADAAAKERLFTFYAVTTTKVLVADAVGVY